MKKVFSSFFILIIIITVCLSFTACNKEAKLTNICTTVFVENAENVTDTKDISINSKDFNSGNNCERFSKIFLYFEKPIENVNGISFNVLADKRVSVNFDIRYYNGIETKKLVDDSQFFNVDDKQNIKIDFDKIYHFKTNKKGCLVIILKSEYTVNGDLWKDWANTHYTFSDFSLSYKTNN